VSQISSPSLAITQESIRVEFRWTGDRFSHSIFSVQDRQAELFLESIEGSPEDSVPASPPFVELHRQGETLFLTGATDVGHWSMSVEPVRLGKQSGFLFDTACRIKSRPDGLTSCYQKAESARASLSNSSLLLSGEGGDLRLEPLPLPDTQEKPSCQLTFTGSEVRLIRKMNRADTLPTTVRWRYRIIA